MAIITLKGNEINTSGALPLIGEKLHNFSLAAVDLSTKTLTDFSGNKLVL